jgi:NhaP-type Na+/H+ or K+/H+ antiporter
MLLTILFGAIAARLLFPHLSNWETGILAAVLAPTDAGLGQIVVNSSRIPMRIRQALNVEAGLNDGLSFRFSCSSPVSLLLKPKAAHDISNPLDSLMPAEQNQTCCFPTNTGLSDCVWLFAEASANGLRFR